MPVPPASRRIRQGRPVLGEIRADAVAVFQGEDGAASQGLREPEEPPDPAMTPEQWVAEEKLMPGALRGYSYVEDGAP